VTVAIGMPRVLAGKLLLALLSREQEFLNRRFVEWALAAAPRRKRRALALRLLALSPHFSDRPFGAVLKLGALEREFARNAATRRAIHEALIRPRVAPSMRVLDFGCGPGYLAKAVSADVSEVIAVDVSRGVIACAALLNPASNITYSINHRSDLRFIGTSSIDLIYSFAVIQHLETRIAADFFREFYRVLRPGGQTLCHLVLGPGEGDRRELRGWEKWLRLRQVRLAPAEAERMARDGGFDRVRLVPIRELARIDDDVGRQHLMLLEKAVGPSWAPANAPAESDAAQ